MSIFRPIAVLAPALVSLTVLYASPRNDALSRYARGEFDVVETLNAEKFDDVRREVKSSALSPQIRAAFLLEAFESFQRRLQLDSELTDPAVGKAWYDASAFVGKMPA